MSCQVDVGARVEQPVKVRKVHWRQSSKLLAISTQLGKADTQERTRMLSRSLQVLKSGPHCQKLTVVRSHHCRGLGNGDFCSQ